MGPKSGSDRSRGGNHGVNKRYAKEKWKYNGDFQQLPTFNQRVESEVMAKSRLAGCILKGYITVIEEKTMLGSMFRHIGGLMTNIMLALLIVTSADPEGTRARVENSFYTRMATDQMTELTEQLREKGVIDYSSMNAHQREVVLQELHEKFDELKVPYKLTEEGEKFFIEDICNNETEEEMIERLKVGMFTPNDLIKAGILSDCKDAELDQFKETGKIPMGIIAEAMSIITVIVKKYMTNRLLNQTKFQHSDGSTKSGYEIYKILQTPSAGGLNNIVYLTRQIMNLEGKNWDRNYEYLQTKHHDLVWKRSQAIKQFKSENDLKLTDENIYSICTAISCIGGNEQAIATNRALLNVDLSRFDDMDQWRDHLRTYQTYSTKKNDNRKQRSVNGAKTGKKPRCFCCNGDHYLSQCKSSSLTEWKTNNKETWERYGKYEKSKQANQAQEKKEDKKKYVTSVRTKAERVQNVRRNERWILDSGASVHITNSTDYLTDIKDDPTVIITPVGEKRLYKKGNRSNEIRDVLINPGGELSLLSVGKYLKDNPAKSIIFTKKGAYEVNDVESMKIPYERKICQERDNLYYFDKNIINNVQQTVTGQENKPAVNNVEPENKVEMIHKRLGHISPENMIQLRKNGWIDFGDKDMKKFESSPCDGCLKASYNKKHSGHKRRDAITRNATRNTEKGHWHCDIMIMTGKSKYKRCLVMVEEKSRYTHIGFTTESFSESEAEHLFEELEQVIQANDSQIKTLRWDGESAIWDKTFKNLCNKKRIRLERSTSGEQNLAESKIATLRERSMKIANSANKLPIQFESDVIRHSCMVTNLLPNATLMGRTPSQEYLNLNPARALGRLKKFGSIAYHRPAGANDSTDKNTSAKPHIFVGFDNLRSANYILYNPITKRNKIVHQATFVETTVTNNWYENLISGQEINYSGGDTNDISFIPMTPMTFQDEDQNEQNFGQKEENEFNDIPDLTEASDSEEDEDEEYYESSDDEDEEQVTEEKQAHENLQAPTVPLNKPLEVNDDEQKISNNSQETVRPRRNRTVHDYNKLDKNGTTIIGNVRTEATEIKKGKDNIKISIIGNTIKVEKKETKKVNKKHETLIKEKYPKVYDIKIPKNRREMLKTDYREEFMIAEKLELRTITNHGTIKFVPETPNAHKLKTRMVYDIKSDENGEVVKFKARLVALGYDQRKDEYHETFAPVARVTTIMILLVFGWLNNMDIRLLDFKGAYLHANRPQDTPVYLNEIPGIKTPPGMMNFLDKGLYGTLDAGNLWRQEVEKLLRKHGFKQAINDPCLYIKRTKEGITIIATWVDDLLIISNDKDNDRLKEKFENDGFEISHFGNINDSKYLGMNVTYDKDKKILEIDQTEMIEGLLSKSKMSESKSISTPMYDNKVMTRSDQPKEKLKEVKLNFQINGNEVELRKKTEEIKNEMKLMNKVPFRSILGSLSHITRMTRCDIMYATFYLARHQKDPGLAHWKGLKRELRYLKGTKDLILKANKMEPLFDMYCDSDNGGDPNDGKSTTGIIARMHGIPILTKSSIQRMNAKSSTNAEIIALCDAVEELVYIKNLTEELGLKINPTIRVDNQPAIDTMINQKMVKGNKHIMNRYYFVKDYYKKGIINLSYIPTKDNLADIFTKPLKRDVFENIRNRIMDIKTKTKKD